IGFGDTVIISASAIPGNETSVGKVIDGLFEKGAYVVYDRMADVHVSGHACREELKLMLHITKPKYFIPVHGEFRHLMTHGRLALDMGVPEQNVFVLNIGEVVAFTRKGAAKAGEVPSGVVMVDGSKSIEDAVIRDRRELSSQGLVVAVISVDKETGRQIAPVELISRGFVYMKEAEELMEQAAEAIAPEVRRFETEDKANYGDIKTGVKSKLKSFFKSKTKRTPLIIPIVIEGDRHD
ncbi:MAG: ribonuclease J, partial [Oscillospiraceae bacterium]|nr:ribonuclease J [Oscillospiraceae bacterium]